MWLKFDLIIKFVNFYHSGVSTSIKAHNFARLLHGPLSNSVASNSKLGLFPKSRYPERFLTMFLIVYKV